MIAGLNPFIQIKHAAFANLSEDAFANFSQFSTGSYKYHCLPLKKALDICEFQIHHSIPVFVLIPN